MLKQTSQIDVFIATVLVIVSFAVAWYEIILYITRRKIKGLLREWILDM